MRILLQPLAFEDELQANCSISHAVACAGASCVLPSLFVNITLSDSLKVIKIFFFQYTLPHPNLMDSFLAPSFHQSLGEIHPGLCFQMVTCYCKHVVLHLWEKNLTPGYDHQIFSQYYAIMSHILVKSNNCNF